MYVDTFHCGNDDTLSYYHPIALLISMRGNIVRSISVHRETIYRPPTRERESEKENVTALTTHPRLWLSVLSGASSVTESCVRGP